MNRQITQNNLKDNTFFWYTYIKWFNGYDDINEINIDEALEVIGIDKEKLAEWEEQFYSIDKGGESLKELWGEGFRLYDILRTQAAPVRRETNESFVDDAGKTVAVMGHYILKFPDGSSLSPNSKYFLFPIPLNELNNNPNLQN